jgi:hypothetical protein
MNLNTLDPWHNRSASMRCSTCTWFVPKIVQQKDVGPEDVETPKTISVPSKLGRCRRHAPTMNGYPAVFVSDWCGDHKLNELAVS